MEIIDEKGKVFGKINLIDLLIVVVVLAVVGVALKFLLANEEWITVELKLSNQPLWIMDALYVGDFDGKPGDVNAEVTDIEVIASSTGTPAVATLVSSITTGKISLGSSKELTKDIILTAKMRVTTKTENNHTYYSFKGDELKLGSAVELKLGNADISGVVTRIGDINKTYLDVTLAMQDQPSWLPTAVKIGDVERTSSGRINARILGVNVFPGSEAATKTVFLNAQIAVYINENGVPVFKANELKLGSEVNIELSDISITGVITDFSQPALVGMPQKNLVKKIVEIKLGLLPLWVVSSLKRGDVEKDYKGDVIAKVTDIDLIYAPEIVASALRVVTGVGTSSKDISVLNARDVTLRVEITTEQNGDTVVFKGNEVKINAQLYLNINGMDLPGIVTLIKDPNESSKIMVERLVTVLLPNQPIWIASALHEDDAEKDYQGHVTARIIGIEKAPTTGIGNDILLTLKINAEQRGEYMLYRGQEIRINSPLDLRINNIDLKGNVTSIEYAPDKIPDKNWVEKNIILRMDNQPKWLVEAIHVGDTEMGYRGDVIASVTSVSTLSYTDDLRNVDILVGLKIRAEQKGDYITFKNSKLKVNEPLTVELKTIDLKGKVAEIN